jgi:hypothetical protein
MRAALPEPVVEERMAREQAAQGQTALVPGVRELGVWKLELLAG